MILQEYLHSQPSSCPEVWLCSVSLDSSGAVAAGVVAVVVSLSGTRAGMILAPFWRLLTLRSLTLLSVQLLLMLTFMLGQLQLLDSTASGPVATAVIVNVAATEDVVHERGHIRKQTALCNTHLHICDQRACTLHEWKACILSIKLANVLICC